tara:strand:+ start:416 stop:796 length:381 start_codon:yes stop_codon:yes gene_type:complete
MAHFAEIDENNLVLRVVVINDSDCLDESDNESETVGINFCKTLFGGNWVQTSYNHSVRKNYACVGAEYRADLDAFIHPTPFASWVLNETTCKWEAPTAYPADGWSEDNTDGFDYSWNESGKNWARK